MTITVYEDILRDNPGTLAWAAIDREALDVNPFLTLTWARAWLSSYQDVDRSLLWREHGLSGETLLALMVRGGELRSLCYNAADYTGSVQASGHAHEPVSIAEALLLKANELPTILWNVSDHDPVVQALKRRAALTTLEQTPMPFVDLAEVRADLSSWPKSSASRRQAHRDFRRLLRDGAEARFGIPRDEVDLDEFIALHTEAWRSRGLPGNFGDARRRAFVRRLLTSDLPLYISTLRHHDALLAYRLGFRSPTRVYGWNSGFSITHRDRGPGSALLFGELMHLAGDPDLRVVDLLRGDEAYKRSYSSGTSYVHTFRVDGAMR